jgi:hypothetical protein
MRLTISIVTVFLLAAVLSWWVFSSTSPKSVNSVAEKTKSALLPKPTEVPLIAPPESYVLPQGQFVSQSFNNCGPASLSMVLSMYGKSVSQETLRQEMRPFSNPLGGVDDKSIFAPEFVKYAQMHGMEALQRPGGDIELVKKLVANGVPVIVRTWLHPNEDIGHFRIVRGYNDTTQIFIQDDSYEGPNLSYSYSEFLSMWQPFNYGYILVYPKDKEPVVKAILGEDMDEKKAYSKAIVEAEKSLMANPDDRYALFNLASTYYHLGDYQKSVDYYEKAKAQLPSRMLWYQLEPIYAYAKLNNGNQVMLLADGILNNGNLAYSELYQLKGEEYLKQGNRDAAKAEFEKAVFYNSNFQPAKDALAQL